MTSRQAVEAILDSMTWIQRQKVLAAGREFRKPLSEGEFIELWNRAVREERAKRERGKNGVR